MKPLSIFLLIAALHSARGSAEPHHETERSEGLVTLDLDGCRSGNVELIRTVVRLELGDLLRTSVRPEQLATAVRAECEVDKVLIRVDDPFTNKVLQRTLAVNDSSNPSEARIIGLAIAELVAASWVELELEPARSNPAVPSPEVARVEAFVRTRVRTRHRPLKRHWSPGVHVRASDYSTGLSLRGAGASLSRTLTEHLDLHGTFDFVQGRQDGSAGAIDVQSPTLSAVIGGRLRIDRIDLIGGAGMRVGVVTLRGQNEPAYTSATSFSSPWGGAMGFVGLRMRPASKLQLQVGAEYGAVLLGVSARVLGHVQPQIEGRWLAATAGVALVL